MKTQRINPGRRTSRLLVGATASIVLAMGAAEAFAAAVLFTAGADTSGALDPVSSPPTANPHIPSLSTGVTLTPPQPIYLGGVAVGPLNGITYGPGAFGGSTGGTTGFINVSYTITAGDFGFPLFVEVANVGDTAFESGLALDNIKINGVTVEGFESGVPGSFTTNGNVTTSTAVAGLAPTEGLSFLFMDTVSTASAVFDTVDGTNASNIFAPLGLAVGDVLSFDIAFMTTDGTSTYHDYGLAALGVPQVQGVPEPASMTLVGLGLAVLGLRRRQRSRT